MFETMQGFLAFFIPVFALIILGIIFEEKLIRFEQAVWVGILMTVRDWAEDKLKKESEGGAATWANRTSAITADRC